MRFNPKARLDTSRVRDVGGSSGGGGGTGGGGGMRIPIPGGTKAGGGIGGVLIVILFLVLTQCMNNGGTGGLPLPDNGLNTSRMAGSDTGRYANCKTGADANENVDCSRVAVENSLYNYWSKALPEQSDAQFQPEAMQTFSGGTSTGCGDATAEVGPFYCPVDATIYLDTTFFEQVLQQQLNGPSGAFVEPYVVAHEYGHHIQNLLGTMGQVKTQQGPNSDSVRLELQADCYAGMWAKYATTVEDDNGQVFILDLTQDDINRALDAAAAVGDDRIQQETSGRIDPDAWTHGSAEQRMRWFTTGYKKGTLEACDTFGTDRL